MLTLRSKLLIAVLMGALVVPIGAGVVLAAPGDLDTTFGIGGIVTTNIGGSGVPERVATMADGRVVASTDCLGTSFDFCIYRFNEDGTPDTTFDSDGMAETDFTGTSDSPWGLAVQSDGRIVAAGECGPNSASFFCVARYNTDGGLDTSFSGDGLVVTDVNNNATTNTGGSKGRALVLQPDGKIVVAGYCGAFDATFTVQRDACVVRYAVDGTLDPTFSGDGIAMYDLGTTNDYVVAAGLQSDGHIVIGGNCGASFPGRWCVARLTGSGVPDSSFGVLATLMGVSGSGVTDIGITGTDQIVAAGQCQAIAFAAQSICVARYSSGGALDTTFNGTGTTSVLPGGGVGGNAGGTAVAIQENSKIVAVNGCANPGFTDFCAVRWNTDGTLDASFGTGGITMTQTSAIANNDWATDIAVAANGKIVVSGYCPSAWCLVRYMGDPIVTGPVTPDLQIHDASHAVLTTVIAGTTIHPRVAAVPPAGGNTPTGSITVNWYSSGTCKGGSTSATASLGGDGTVDMTSLQVTPAKAGTYAFRVSYGGDSRYAPVVGACAPITVVGKLTPTITSVILDGAGTPVTSVSPGTAVHDNVTVSGGLGTPTGTVTLKWFTSNRCKGKAVSSAPLALDSAGSVDATSFTQTPAAGLYAFQATYSGDATYLAAIGPCETLTVQ